MSAKLDVCLAMRRQFAVGDDMAQTLDELLEQMRLLIEAVIPRARQAL